MPNAKKSSPHCPAQALPLTPVLNALNSVKIPMIANMESNMDLEPRMLIEKNHRLQSLELIA